MDLEKLRARIIGLVDLIGCKSYYPVLQSRLQETDVSKARLKEKSEALQITLEDLEHAQALVRKSEERFRRLAENAADIIFRLNVISPITFEYISPAAQPITGYTPHEFYNDIDLIERLVHPDDHTLLQTMQQGLLPSGTPVVMHWIRKDGADLWVEMRHALVYDGAGRLVAIEGIVRDITQSQQEVRERRRAEEALKLAVSETQQLNHRLSALYEVSLALAKVIDLETVFRVAYEHVARVADLALFAISLFDPSTRMLRMKFAVVDGAETDTAEFPAIRLEENSSTTGRGQAIFSGMPVQVLGLIEKTRAAIKTGRVKVVGAGSSLPDSAFYLPLISAGQVIGLMELQSYHSNPWDPDQEALLGATANQIALAIERAGLYEQMSASLSEKEVLLREVHHRVKNNLEVVISLAELQSHSLEDTVALNSLRDYQARVRTIALIHENLYLSANIASIRADVFLNRLVDSLMQAFSPSGVALIVDSDASSLDVETATPIGLVVTELVTNAIKHAFPSDARKAGSAASVHLHPDGNLRQAGSQPTKTAHQVNINFGSKNGAYRLEVCDNGVGLPDGLDWRTTRSLGLRLVNRLAEQVHGELEVFSAAGTCFRLTFPAGEANE